MIHLLYGVKLKECLEKNILLNLILGINRMKNPEWKQFQDYIAQQLKEIDPYARSTKASGAKGEIGDVNNKYMIIECKLRNVKSPSINMKTWFKLNREVPISSERFPMLALKQKDGYKFAVLDLDQYLEDFIELTQRREGTYNEKGC